MKNVSGRDFMYIGGVIMLPIVLAFKDMWLYSIGALLVAIALYSYDSIFKSFRKNIHGGRKFLIITLISGFIMALIATLWEDIRITLIVIWFLFSYIYGMKIAKRVDE